MWSLFATLCPVFGGLCRLTCRNCRMVTLVQVGNIGVSRESTNCLFSHYTLCEGIWLGIYIYHARGCSSYTVPEVHPPIRLNGRKTDNWQELTPLWPFFPIPLLKLHLPHPLPPPHPHHRSVLGQISDVFSSWWRSIFWWPPWLSFRPS